MNTVTQGNVKVNVSLNITKARLSMCLCFLSVCINVRVCIHMCMYTCVPVFQKSYIHPCASTKYHIRNVRRGISV